jgi:type II secretory pathway pseudopilin PulG
MKRSKAFTIIELLIIVALIGILAQALTPTFLQMQARAKQSEAQQNLSAIYTAYQSYFSDHNTFPSTYFITVGNMDYNCISITGWQPKGRIRYNYNCVGVEAFSPATNNSSCSPAVATYAAQFSFTIAACGNVDNDTVVDEWGIDNSKRLRNFQDDAQL